MLQNYYIACNVKLLYVLLLINGLKDSEFTPSCKTIFDGSLNFSLQMILVNLT